MGEVSGGAYMRMLVDRHGLPKAERGPLSIDSSVILERVRGMARRAGMKPDRWYRDSVELPHPTQACRRDSGNCGRNLIARVAQTAT